MVRKCQTEGLYIYIQLIHFAIWQKLTQHCKATIPRENKRLMAGKCAAQSLVKKHTFLTQVENTALMPDWLFGYQV